MTDITHDEINRIWADLAALKVLIAEDIGHRWGADRINRWHARAVTAHESAMADNPAVMASMVRALDDLAVKLRRGVPRSDGSE